VADVDGMGSATRMHSAMWVRLYNDEMETLHRLSYVERGVIQHMSEML